MANYTGTNRNDTYLGSPGADLIKGLGGDDTLSGASGNDTIDGGYDDDELHGGGGDDLLRGGAGNDVVYGDAGNDRLVWNLSQSAGSIDEYSGGAGIDTWRADLTTSEWLDPVVQQQLALWLQHVASVPHNAKGEIAAGPGLDYRVDIRGAAVELSMIEQLAVMVDSTLVDHLAPTFRSGDLGASFVEDATGGVVSDLGALQFYDLNWEDVHRVSSVVQATPFDGQVQTMLVDAATGDGQGTALWTYEFDNASSQWLAEGQTASDVFAITVADGSGRSFSRTLTASVTGRNDAPVAGALAGDRAVSEDEASPVLRARGSMEFSDVDLADSHTAAAVAAAGNALGGRLQVQIADPSTGDGAGRVGWTYTLANAAVQYLAAGQTATETFEVRVRDGEGARASRDVTFTAVGTNDAPTLGAAAGDTLVVEDESSPELHGSGSVAFADVDLADSHGVGVTPAAGNALGGTLVASLADAGTGDGAGRIDWFYTVPNAAVQLLGEGQTASEVFQVALTDSGGASIPHTVTMTVIGRNDVPVITGRTTRTVTEDGDKDADPATVQVAKGQLSVSDPDGGDTYAWSVIAGAEGVYGRFKVNANGRWTYTLDNDAAQPLRGSDAVVESATIQADDGSGTADGTATQVVSVTVEGVDETAAGADQVVSPPGYYTHVVETSPKLAALTDGGHVVVWTAPDGNGDGVYQQRYAATGAKVGDVTRVNVSNSDNEHFYDAVGTSDGGYMVLWSGYFQQGDSEYGIYARRYDANGATIGNPEMHLNQETDGQQPDPGIAVLANGGFAAVWNTDPYQGTGYDVVARIFDAGMQPLPGVAGNEFKVNTHLPDWDVAWGRDAETVAGLTGGRFAVTWNDRNVNDNRGYGVDTFARVYEADGTPVTVAMRVNTTTGGKQGHAFVATLDDGFIVTWASTGDGSGTGIYARRFDSDGQAIEGADFLVNGWTSGDQEHPQAVQLSDDEFAIVWQSAGVEGGTDIHGQRFDAGGAKVGSEFIVNDHASQDFGADNEKFLSLALHSDGSLVVAWLNSSDRTVEQTVVDDFAADTTPIAAPPLSDEAVGPLGFYGLGAAKLAALADGGHVVVWSAEDGAGEGVWLQRYGASGQKVGGLSQVNVTNTDNEHFVDVAALPDGGFMATWSGYFQQGDDGYGIYARRYAADGTTVGDPEAHLNVTTEGPQNDPVLALLAGGGYVAVWDNGFGEGYETDYDVFARIFDDAGVAVTEEFRVNTVLPGSNLELGRQAETVVGLSAGRFAMVWNDEVQPWGAFGDPASYKGVGTFTRVFEADGTPVNAQQVQVNTTTVGKQGDASIAALGDGFIVAWCSDGDGNGKGVYAQRFDDEGARIGGEIAVNGWTSGDQVYPQPMQLADGSFVIVWQSAGTAGGQDIHGQRFDAGGAKVGSEFIVNDHASQAFAAQDETQPSLALREDGALVVSWVDMTTRTVEQTVIDDFEQDTTPLAATSAAEAGIVYDPATGTLFEADAGAAVPAGVLAGSADLAAPLPMHDAWMVA